MVRFWLVTLIVGACLLLADSQVPRAQFQDRTRLDPREVSKPFQLEKAKRAESDGIGDLWAKPAYELAEDVLGDPFFLADYFALDGDLPSSDW